MEPNLGALKERRLYLSASSAEKCNRKKKKEKMLEPSKKHHMMNLRNNGKLNIPNVQTARRRKTCIINMINHVNKKQIKN